MAFGDVRGTPFSGTLGSITNPTTTTGSISGVAVGDLIFAYLAQQTNLTVTAVTDNLGNTYSAVDAGVDYGNASSRAFYSYVTNAGTLTSVSFTCSASTNDVAVGAVVFEGPFVTSPLDKAPTQISGTTDITSPFTCPASGTLTQADELIVSYVSTPGTPAAGWSATSPNTKRASASISNVGFAIGSQVVAATTSVAPEWTGTNPAADSLGTATFMKDTGGGTAHDGAATLVGAGAFSESALVFKFADATFAGNGTLSANTIFIGLLRPDADDLDGGWTNELGGTSLFPSIDEASPPEDADYIQSSAAPSADICRVRLTNPSSGVAAPAKIRVRYQKTGTDQIDLTVRLKQGTTEIASWNYTNIADTFVTVTETLTGPQFASITDFSDLFIEFQAD